MEKHQGAIFHLPFTIFHLSPPPSFLAAAKLRCISVSRSPGSQYPADHDADEEDGGDEDEVGGGDPAHQRRPPASILLATSAISRSIAFRRFQIEKT